MKDSDSEEKMEDDERHLSSSSEPPTSDSETDQGLLNQSELFSTEAFPTSQSMPFNSLLSDLPHEIKIQTSSFFNLQRPKAIKALPRLDSCTTLSELENLMILKLRQCSILYDFTKGTLDLPDKEIKRSTLNELITFACNSNSNFLTLPFYNELFHMFQENAFRIFPHNSDLVLDDEEEETYYEASWPHLSLVYEFMKIILESNHFDSSMASSCLTESYLSQIIELFDSRDCREREQLRNILHRLYSRLFVFRPFLRRCISMVFLRYIYDDEPFKGMSSLLDIFSSIIHGFALPLKEEHVQFLIRVLLPLHKGKDLHHYHEELQICILYFIIKDDSLGIEVIKYISKNWPKTSSYNQILVMSEVERIISILQTETLKQCIDTIFKLISKLMLDQQFQIVEKALLISKNSISNLGEDFAACIISHVYSSIRLVSKDYWNPQISGLANNILLSLRQQYSFLCSSLE